MTSIASALRRLLRGALLCLAAGVPVAAAQDAAALLARHAELREPLARNGFERPLHLDSSERAATLTGEVHARMPQPFGVAGPALREIAHWCDILILHPNIKGCRAGADALLLGVGRHSNPALAPADELAFSYEVAASTPDYLRVVLEAPDGPFGTSHYRVVLEVAAVEGGSFLRLSYAYRTAAASRWALRAYLATLGRARVGFSVVGRKPDGRPVYIGSTRGMVERNAMRCYLAIEAYLGALPAPESEQAERRLHHWYAGVAQFPLQLQDVTLGEYLAMKRTEIRRQQARVSSSVQTSAPPGATLGDASAPAPLLAAPTSGSSP